MRTATLLGFGMLFVLGSRAPAADGPPCWEYRALSRAQVVELGKNDFVAGLNKLGEEGWELVSVTRGDDYIFKRPGLRPEEKQRAIEQLRSRVRLIETDYDTAKDRLAWSERMVKKGFLAENQLQAEKDKVKAIEDALKEAKLYLQKVDPQPERNPEKIQKPREVKD